MKAKKNRKQILKELKIQMENVKLTLQNVMQNKKVDRPVATEEIKTRIYD